MSREKIEFEVVVVGAGPAGLAAAAMATESGKRVAIIDNSPLLGGQIWRSEPGKPTPGVGRQWISRLEQSGAVIFSSATVFAAPGQGSLLAETSSAVLQISWRKLILATGARELFIPFPGWTLPGVIGPGGLHAMAKAGWPVAGKRIIIAGSGPLLLAVADGLKRHGAHIVLVTEQASWSKVIGFGLSLARYPAKLLQGLRIKARISGVPCYYGGWVLEAENGAPGLNVTLTSGSRTWKEPCDYLACAFNLVPNLELPKLLACKLERGLVRVNDFQETSTPDVFCAGEPTGIGGADCALVEGQIAGLSAVGQFDRARSLFRERSAWHRFRAALNGAFALRPELRRLAKPSTLVCRCEDVTRGELEGFTSWRAAKLLTRCGMGTCQGRICGAATQFLFGWENDSVRAPVFPVRAASLLCNPLTSDSTRTATTQQTKG